MSRPRTFAERYPDSARSGSSSNLIAGELIEARSLIPLVDLRDTERVHWSLMWAGLEPFPRRTVRSLVAEHWQSAVGLAILPAAMLVEMLIFW